MHPNEPGSLPEWIEKAYEIFVSELEGREDALLRNQAHQLLLDHDEFPTDSADAEHAIERLLDTGWLYEVDGEIRITDPDGE